MKTSKNCTKTAISQFVFFWKCPSLVTQSLITPAMINIVAWFLQRLQKEIPEILMDSDFGVRPPKMFGKNFAISFKKWPKYKLFAQNGPGCDFCANFKWPSLYLLSFRFGFLGPFLLQSLTRATIGAKTQNLPQKVGISPGHRLQLVARNHVFEIFRGETQTE